MLERNVKKRGERLITTMFYAQRTAPKTAVANAVSKV